MKKRFQIYKNNIQPSHDILLSLSRNAMTQDETKGRNAIVNALIDGAMALKALESGEVRIDNKGEVNELYSFEIETNAYTENKENKKAEKEDA